MGDDSKKLAKKELKDQMADAEDKKKYILSL